MIAEIKTLSAYRYREKTLQNAIPCAGVGLHSGDRVRLTLKPAGIGAGIRFVRTDVTDKNNVIPASYLNVADARLCSCLANADGVSVSTVEHLMAALAGFGITNATIEVDGPEVPVMDGSALDFVTLIQCAGIMELDAPLKAVKILKEVVHADGKGTEVCLYPAREGLEIDFMIDFRKSSAIGRQEYSIALTERDFCDSVAYARTFCMAQEVEAMHKAGLARGGSLDNAVVVEDDKVLNPTGLRSENEFVVHKTLDVIGDLWQLGMPIIGHFSGAKSGHAQTNALLRKVMADKDAYAVVTMDEYMDELLSGRKNARRSA